MLGDLIDLDHLPQRLVQPRQTEVLRPLVLVRFRGVIGFFQSFVLGTLGLVCWDAGINASTMACAIGSSNEVRELVVDELHQQILRPRGRLGRTQGLGRSARKRHVPRPVRGATL